MSVEPLKPTRREVRRGETIREIKALATRQVADSGPDAVSLNAIARSMGMAPAALYRYFDSREDLLADLVVDAYDAFADALEAGSQLGRSPEKRLVAVANASREWALAHPNAYRLIFQTTAGSGQELAPERTIPAASRSMAVLLTALAAVADPADSRSSDPTPGREAARLRQQLAEWAERSGVSGLSPRVLALGFVTWTRLHGVISLELGHHLGSTGIDPAVLYAAEVDALIREAQH